MLRARFLTSLMISGALVMLAASAQGGANFNRLDILDVDESSSYQGTTGSMPFSWAFMYADDDWASVWGSMSGSVQDANNRVRIWSQLYQPDTMKRNHRMAKADQKRYTAVWVALYALPTGTQTTSPMVASNSGHPEKCKAQIKADDRDKDGSFDMGLLSSGEDRIRARLRCPKDVLEQLGFTPVEVGAIQGLIGTRTKFNIRLP
jgi:hypothetical protein